MALPTPDPLAAQGDEAFPEGGIPVDDPQVVRSCQRCHRVDDDTGRMTRISYMRKTPEGWQTTIRRMVALSGVRLEPEVARGIVRYLSNRHGIAPEELRPGLFEVERRLIDHRYEADEDTEFTCIQCHSMGRVITQRRTREEWGLLIATHRGLYPLSDFQAFRMGDPPEDGVWQMDHAVEHLSSAFPLETAEWSAWAATMRPPRLAGTWALVGHAPGSGPVFGEVRITRGAAADEFVTDARYTFAADGHSTRRSGRAIVYTGYQWRGRSFEGTDPEAETGTGELREVMTVDRGWNGMSGRWFAGAYDELGPDVRLVRADAGTVIAGVHPRAAPVGRPAEITVYGVGLPAEAGTEDFDFGPGILVSEVQAGSAGSLVVGIEVEAGAPPGARDLFIAGASLPGALIVYERMDRIEVTPQAGMARIGGANFPKGYQQFEAVGFSDGPDGEADTDDDLELGVVDATWSLEEYSAVFDDDDLRYVGVLDQRGLFTPAADGPNPERPGNRNNVGDVWVVAEYTPPGAAASARPLRARAHLLVTVPLYMRWEPWRVGG